MRNQGRRYHGKLCRYHATQFAKNRIWRFLLDHRLESFNQLFGEITRLARGFEQA